jgi:hypothetical protein
MAGSDFDDDDDDLDWLSPTPTVTKVGVPSEKNEELHTGLNCS